MSKSIDAFFHRTYNEKHYNCAHLVSEVWKHETGQDISEKLQGFLFPPKERFVPFEIRREFVSIEKLKSPCIVIFQRNKFPPHVGIFLRGRVLHIQPRGVEFQPLEVVKIGFDFARFYVCRQ